MNKALRTRKSRFARVRREINGKIDKVLEDIRPQAETLLHKVQCQQQLTLSAY